MSSESKNNPWGRISAWWPLPLLVSAIVLFFGGGLWTGAESLFTHDIGFSDHWHFHVPLKKIYQDALSHGEIPWWSHELSTGFPLVAEGQLGALYPPNMLLFSIFGLSQALGLALVLHLLWAGWGALVLGKDKGLTPGPAALCALVFMCSGFMITHAKHLNMIEAAAWLPWLLLEASRVARGESKGARLGVFTALSLLAGHPQMTYYTLLAAGVMGATELPWRTGLSGWVRPLSRGLLAVLAGALLSSPQWIHTLELAGESARGAGMTWEEANTWSYTPEMLKLLFQPDAFGDPALLVETPEGGLAGFSPPGDTQAFYWEVTGYLGILPWALLLFLVCRPERKRALPYLALGAGSLLVALGQWGGVGELLFYGLPGYDLFRFHSRWLLVFGLAMAVVAGFGFQAFLQWLPAHQQRYAPWLVACVLLVAWSDSFLALGHHNPRIGAEQWLTPPASAEQIRGASAGDASPFRVIVQDPGDRSFQSAYVAARGWSGDLSPYHGARAAFRPNLGALYGLNNLFYYFHLAPDRLKKGVETALLPGGAISQVHAGRLNVKYLVAAGPRKRGGDTQCLGGGPATCVQVLPNPQVRPRYTLASFAHVVEPGPQSAEAALRTLLGADFNPAKDVVIEGPRALAMTNGEGHLEGSVQLEEYGNHHVAMTVRANRPAWMVTSDTFYPGWSARLNGEATAIYPANTSGRAVLIPPGIHQLEMTYQPSHEKLGWILLVLGFALCLALWKVGAQSEEIPD